MNIDTGELYRLTGKELEEIEEEFQIEIRNRKIGKTFRGN